MAAADPAVGAILLSGRSKTFNAGMDLAEVEASVSTADSMRPTSACSRSARGLANRSSPLSGTGAGRRDRQSPTAISWSPARMPRSGTEIRWRSGRSDLRAVSAAIENGVRWNWRSPAGSSTRGRARDAAGTRTRRTHWAAPRRSPVRSRSSVRRPFRAGWPSFRRREGRGCNSPVRSGKPIGMRCLPLRILRKGFVLFGRSGVRAGRRFPGSNRNFADMRH